MTLPTGLTAVEVRGRYIRNDGSIPSGTVTLTPTTTRDSASLNLTVFAASIRITIDNTGQFARTVAAGNDPDLSAISYMRVEERIDGESRTYIILVPESASATGLDLADAPPLEPVSDMAGYVLISGIGVSVAPLVSDLVPTVHLPPSPGVLSAPVTVDGVLTVTVTSNWGLTSAGGAYYDPDGATSADAAIASLGPSGLLIITRPGG